MITDVKQQLEEEKRFFDDAEKYFKNQVGSLQSIANTEGYNQIKLYRASRLDEGYNKLKSCQSDKLQYRQSYCTISEGFLAYLDTIQRTTV